MRTRLKPNCVISAAKLANSVPAWIRRFLNWENARRPSSLSWRRWRRLAFAQAQAPELIHPLWRSGLDDVIQKHVDRALANTSKALSDAVAGLRETAKQIARSDMPTEEEAEALLRNAPRFEMASVPRPIGAVFWRWFGRKTATALARHSLRQAFGESFKDELHRYGRALSQWSEHTARRMQSFVVPTPMPIGHNSGRIQRSIVRCGKFARARKRSSRLVELDERRDGRNTELI